MAGAAAAAAEASANAGGEGSAEGESEDVNLSMDEVVEGVRKAPVSALKEEVEAEAAKAE